MLVPGLGLKVRVSVKGIGSRPFNDKIIFKSSLNNGLISQNKLN